MFNGEPQRDCMTENFGVDSQARRPAKRSAVISPTASTNLISSALVLAGLFLPHSVDCDRQAIRPISIVNRVVERSDKASDYLALAILWPFAFAAVTMLMFIVLVILRPSWYAHALLGVPLFTACALIFGWCLLLFSNADTSRYAMLLAVMILPAGGCVAARVLWLYRAGKIVAAATWAQGMVCVLAAFSLRWFWFPPVTRLLWGGILTIACCCLMMVSSWCWINRARHDLFDRSSAPPPFQISLRQVVWAITLVAIALTYWRLFETY